MTKYRIDNADMRNWFFRIYKHHIGSTTGLPIPQKVFDYLKEKTLVEGIPEACRLSKDGFLAVRQIFSNDELRGKHARSEPKSTVSTTSSLF